MKAKVKFNLNKFFNNIISKTKQTVIHDSFDEMTFNELKEKSETIQEIPQKVDFPTINELLFDTFNTFYKYDPKFHNDEEIQEDYLINKEMLQKAMKTEEYRKLRVITKLDEVNSAVATASFIETVIQEIKKRDPNIEKKLEELKQQQQERLNLIQQLSQAQSSLQQAQSQLNQNPQNQQLKQQVNQMQQQVNQLQQHLNQLNQQIQQQVSNINKSVRQIAVSKAINKASQDTKEINNAIMAFGWGKEASTLQKVPAEERIKFANALMQNQKLLKLVRELGKMKRLLISTRKSKVKRQTSEIYDVSMGDDIARLIPAELAKLTIPELKMDFFKRFAEKQLLQYSLRDKESKGKGDIVVCLDLSGSMSGAKEIWAKAVSLACLELAVREKRGYALITFGTDVKKVRQFDRHNLPSLGDVIDVAEEWYSSSEGTNYEKPLTKATELLKDYKEADILFITDGECRVSQEFAESFYDFRRRTDTKVVSVMIGNYSIKTLEILSDKVVRVEDFLKGAKDIFEAIV